MTREPDTTAEDALRARLKEAPSSHGELDGLFSQIEAGVKRADAHPLASVRGAATRTRRAIAIGSFIAIFVFTLLTNARADMSLYPMPRLVVECAADRNPLKIGARTLGTNIPIVSEEESRARKPDYYLVLPWHFRSEFLEREAATIRAGTKMLFPLPDISIVSSETLERDRKGSRDLTDLLLEDAAPDA